MHKAKGLEFDTVLLPGLGRSPKQSEQQLLLWLERSGPDGRSDLLMAPRTGTGEGADPVYAYLQRLIKQKSRHEDGRLLYVAATRARKCLHLLGHTTLNKDGSPRFPGAGSLLAALWPAVRETFEQAADAAEEPGREDRRDGSLQEQGFLGQTLYRLASDWEPPELPEGLRPVAPVAPEPKREAVEFDWAGQTVRCAGTCVHGWLLVLAGQGPEGWGSQRVRELRPVFARQLLDLGIREAELDSGVDLVQQALQNTIAHEVGRWILGPRREARNEYPMSGLVQGEIVSVVMDRTFVDESGVRWIIDYKTSRHEGGDLSGFLDREKLRYQAQMETYARLMRAREGRPIRLGLYFPLLSGWREWGFG
jgi:hypothetical protein